VSRPLAAFALAFAKNLFRAGSALGPTMILGAHDDEVVVHDVERGDAETLRDKPLFLRLDVDKRESASPSRAVSSPVQCLVRSP